MLVRAVDLAKYLIDRPFILFLFGLWFMMGTIEQLFDSMLKPGRPAASQRSWAELETSGNPFEWLLNDDDGIFDWLEEDDDHNPFEVLLASTIESDHIYSDNEEWGRRPRY